MSILFNCLTTLSAGLSALFWFLSARVKIIPIIDGGDALGNKNQPDLVDSLVQQGKYNKYAAVFACVAAVSQVLSQMFNK